MLQTLRIEQLSTDALILLTLLAIVAGAVIGYLTDVVMKDRGFGPFGNGLLAILGAAVGLHVRLTIFGTLKPGDIALTCIFATATATLMLLIFGVIKSFARR